MFRAGRRLFSSASLALIVVAGLHTLGHFSGGPPEPARDRLEAEMQAFKLELGLGMAPSILDVMLSLSLTMSVCLLWLGLQNLVVASSQASDGTIRRLCALSALGTGALVIVYWSYRVPPPLVTLAVVELLFLAALAPSRRSSPV